MTRASDATLIIVVVLLFPLTILLVGAPLAVGAARSDRDARRL
jgi:hypothetical protein